MNIAGLTAKGQEKLLRQLKESGNMGVIAFEVAQKDLIEMISRQANNPTISLQSPPWYASMQVHGTTYPAGPHEHETSDYEEVTFRYYPEDVVLA